MVYRFEIPGQMHSLNEFISANRRSKYAGADMKKTEQDYVCICIKNKLRNVHIEKPIIIHYHWGEKNRRRDLDNIAGFGHKIIQDALVECGIIKDDGWDYIVGFTDSFSIEKGEPKITVELEEIDRNEKKNG